MNKMKQDAEYAQQVRKDPKDTMGAKKDLYGKPKTEAEEFESYIKGLGEEDEEEMLDQIAADEEGFGQVTEEPNEGNEFSGELAKAKAAGKNEFTVGGKRYKVKDHLDLDNDGNEREPMKLAAKQARKANENANTSTSSSSTSSTDDDDDPIARIDAVTKSIQNMTTKGPLKLPNVNAPGVPDMFKVEHQDYGPQEHEGGMNINTNVDTKTGRKSITVTADGKAAEELAYILKMAGLK